MSMHNNNAQNTRREWKQMLHVKRNFFYVKRNLRDWLTKQIHFRIKVIINRVYITRFIIILIFRIRIYMSLYI